jgi:hypothetical protein
MQLVRGTCQVNPLKILHGLSGDTVKTFPYEVLSVHVPFSCIARGAGQYDVGYVIRATMDKRYVVLYVTGCKRARTIDSPIRSGQGCEAIEASSFLEFEQRL